MISYFDFMNIRFSLNYDSSKDTSILSITLLLLTKYLFSNLQETKFDDDEIDPVGPFSPKTTSPSVEMIPKDKFEYDIVSPKERNTSFDKIDEADDMRISLENVGNSGNNELSKEQKIDRSNSECNRKSFSIDRLLFSSKKYQLKSTLLSSNDPNHDPDMSNQQSIDN